MPQVDTPINLHLTILNYQENKKKKLKKKKSKKKISKKKRKKSKSKKKKIEKNLSATFQILSKCHFLNFLSHWGGCLAPRPQVDTPINLHLTIKKTRRRKIEEKKFKKVISKKKFQKNLSQTPKKKIKKKSTL